MEDGREYLLRCRWIGDVYTYIKHPRKLRFIVAKRCLPRCKRYLYHSHFNNRSAFTCLCMCIYILVLPSWLMYTYVYVYMYHSLFHGSSRAIWSASSSPHSCGNESRMTITLQLHNFPILIQYVKYIFSIYFLFIIEEWDVAFFCLW